MKKLLLITSSVFVFFLASLSVTSTADAAWCDQYGCKKDFSYSCHFYHSQRVFTFDGNGYDQFRTKSICYNDARHSASYQVADTRFLYDQFGFSMYGLDQNGRNRQGVCVAGRCQIYHYYQPHYQTPSYQNSSEYTIRQPRYRYYRSTNRTNTNRSGRYNSY